MVMNLFVASSSMSGFLVMPVMVLVMFGFIMILLLVVDGLMMILHVLLRVINVLVVVVLIVMIIVVSFVSVVQQLVKPRLVSQGDSGCEGQGTAELKQRSRRHFFFDIEKLYYYKSFNCDVSYQITGLNNVPY